MKTLDYYKAQTARPGKFQGESPLTVFIWEASLDGCLEPLADQETDSFWAERIHLTGSEMETFGTEVSEWVIIQDSQGFVFSIPFEQFDSWKG